jgi:hypothetical protein
MRAETAHRWTLPKRFSKAARFAGLLRVHDGRLTIAVIRVQTKRQKKVANDIFLHWPAPRVGLSEFHCIDGIGGGDNGNQLGGSRRGRGRFRFPICLPLGRLAIVLVRFFFFFLLLTGNVMAQITNEGHT